jgi:hypothetical protein
LEPGFGAPAGEFGRGIDRDIAKVRSGRSGDIARRYIVRHDLRFNRFHRDLPREENVCFSPELGYTYGYWCSTGEYPYGGWAWAPSH